MRERFGIGQPVRRTEDPRFLTGRGRYAADITLPGQVQAVFLRSPHAHARIRAIDTAAAAAAPGVLAVYTGADTRAAGLGDLPCQVGIRDRAGNRAPRPGRPLLAGNRVRFVGDTVAMVVAGTVAEARDAMDLIDVDYEPLPAVAALDDALAADAPCIWDEAPGNIACHWEIGDAAATDAAFAEAARTVRLELVNNRVAPAPMEPRAVVGAFADGRYTLYTPTQGAHLIRDLLSDYTLKVPADSIRVAVPDVGGAFGTKIYHYAEEALVLWAARQLGAPVKWVGERSEAFTSDTHGRAQQAVVEAAVDGDGRVHALRVTWNADMGAYLNLYAPFIGCDLTGRMLPGAYRIPVLHGVCEGVYTNTTPIDAYRGAGRPEAAYLIERLMDVIAHDLGLGPDEVRRRNFVRPEDMPYDTATGRTYDSGDFARNMDDAMAAAGWHDFPARREAARARGRLAGIGLATYVEACAGGPPEEATVRLEGDGTVTVLIGTQSAGHGHETAYAQIAAERLGVPFDSVRVVQGDTDRIPFGEGTGGSRSIPVGGAALDTAAADLIAKATPVAAGLLQTPADAVTFADGRFSVAGSERGIDLADLTAAADTASDLAATVRFQPPAATFPNGCHVCEVEIDPETGAVTVTRYTVVDDFGTVINPLLAAGQVHGGVAQGIGQALLEEAAFDRETGQPLTASFADYALPRAADLPAIDVAFNTVPCATNPLGAKGAGEAGAIGACPAVINAVVDALAPFGVRHIDMPATPERVWRALGAAGAGPTNGDPK